MDKRVISLVLAIVALIGMVAVASPFTSGSPLTEVYLSPQYNSVVIGQFFSVNIGIANVPTPGLYSYEFKLYYDKAVLQGVSAQIPVGHFLTPVKPSNIFIVDPGTVRQASGYVSFALTLIGNEPGKTGSGVLATVTFVGLAAGSSPLQFTGADVILVDATGNQIASSQYQLRSGSVDVASGPSLMRVSVSPQYSSIAVGQSFSVNINIAHVPSPGIYSYEFNLYYDRTVLQGVSAQIPVGHFLTPVKPSNIFIVDSGTINQVQGRVSFALTLLSNEPGKTGDGVLASVQFTGFAAGSSLLELRDLILVDPNGNQIASSQYQVDVGSVNVLSSPSLIEVYLSPQYNSVVIGQFFSVNISIANVPTPGLYSYELKLYYDRTVLQGVSAQIPSDHFLRPITPSKIFIVDSGTINHGQGYVSFALTLLAPELGKTGSGVLATVTFRGLAAGGSLLQFNDADTILVGPTGNQIASSQYQLRSGSVDVASGPSLMRVSVSPQYSSIAVGQSFSVNISIANVPTPGLYSYELKLYYARTVLQGVSAQIPSDHFLRPITPSKIFIVDPGTVHQDLGYVSFALTLLGNEPGKTGSGVLATVGFRGLAAGSSLLELRDVVLVDATGNLIASSQYGVISGSVNVSPGGSLMEVYLSPQYNSLVVGQSFSVNISIGSVPLPGLYSYELKLYYDRMVLQCVNAYIPSDHFLRPITPGKIFIVDSGTINHGQGYVSFALTLLAPELGKTGDGVLATVTFVGLAAGSSPLQFRDADVILVVSTGNQIDPSQYQLRSVNVNVGSSLVMQQISIADYNVPIDADVMVEVIVENASTIAGGSSDLYFDRSIVNVVSVQSGDFGSPVYLIDNGVGLIKVAAVGATAVGKNIATLAKVTFHGASEGFTLLRLQNAQLNDEKGNVVTPVTRSGSMTVRQTVTGDLNHNARLDTGDATLVLRMVVGLDTAGLSGDMNGNGRIDTGDATLILRKVVGLDG